MPRPPRSLLDGGCYHVIARGNNRQKRMGQALSRLMMAVNARPQLLGKW